MSSSSDDDEEETKRIRQLLKFYKEDFIKDLAVKHVVPDLLQELILSYEDKQLIDGEVTHQAKAKKLLDILVERSEKNPKALPYFKRAVQKNYDWLYNKLTEDVPDHEIVSMKTDVHPEKNGSSHSNESSSKESSKLGWVQSLPPINIERPELIESLTEKIGKLKGNHYLVIHGMAGSGKTVLATQVIRNMCRDQQPRSLESEGYWLSMGKDSGDSNDAIIEKMRILCDKLNIKRAPESVDHGKEILRDALVTRGPVLLVLDNVWSSKVVKAFDVGFRTVVTTRDASVMDVINGRLSYNEQITEGFTEDESLNFFRKALNNQHLPSQARLIHRECKGSPMVISLIASLLQDHQASGVKDSTRWEYYYDSLKKRKYSSLRRDRFYEHASISDAISLSFENLSEKEQSFYQDFALFQHDVSVPCQVLETLWNVTKWKAEDIMRNFVRKSLAVEEYVADRASFKYSLHDLQLDYLKTRMSLNPTKEKDLHKRLIMRYGEKCNYEFHKLPNDGYIHFHLGYHLCKAGQTELFPKIFFDLRFVGEKLKVTGPADLLLDFRKYRNFITCEDDASKDLLEELEELTHQVGFRLYGHADIDIMQVAIQSSHLRNVSAIARDFGKQNPSRLFLDWKNTSSYQGKSSEITLSCGDSVRCAKFIGCEGDLFISGLSNGEIKLCNLASCNVLYVFRSHREAVNSLSIFCPESMQKIEIGQQKRPNIFVSGSDDHTCRLWNIDSALECTEFSDIENGANFDFSPSPKTRQRPFSFDESLEFGFHTAAITCVDFSSDGEKIVSTSANEILIWKTSNRNILQKISTSEAQSCHLCYFPPSSASNYLLAVNESQICVISGSRVGLRSQVNGHRMKIVALIFRNNGSFCTVSENEIALWDVTVGPIPEKKITGRSPVGPSVSVPLTNGAASRDNSAISRSFPSSESISVDTRGDFLHPDMALLGTGKRLSRTSDDCTGTSYILRSGMNSPTSASSQSASGPVTTYIDTPDCGRICIKRAEILRKRSRGLFTCAALDNKFGQLLACGTCDQKIALFQLNKLNFLCEYSAHFGSITTLCFSPVDEFTLLSGSGDQTVKVWDLAEEEKEKTESQKTATFTSLCIGDKFFVSICATERRTIQIYKDTEVVGETAPIDDSITTVGLTKDGSQGAAGTFTGQVIWIKNVMVSGSDGIETEVIGNHQKDVVWMQFGTHKNVLATGSYDRVLIFEDFHPQRVLCADYYKILSLHFAFQDSALAVCCEDGYIEMHKLKTDAKFYKTWKEPIRVSCCLLDGNNNRMYVGTEEDGIYILQLSADLEMTSDRLLECKHRSPIRSLALTVTCDRLAVGHENGLITLWNISKDPCTEEMDLVLHKSRVRHLCFFSKEPTWLLSCGDQLALWTLDKPVDKMRRTTFMEERRRRKSGDKANNRLSMEIPAGQKIGRQGKRELLQTFMFRGNFAQYAACNSAFSKFVTVDNFGVFYFLEVLPS